MGEETGENNPALRLANNSLMDISQLTTCIPFKNIVWLDLSFNSIVKIPVSLSALPLKTLYLHANKLGVDSLNSFKGFHLTCLTLHGNPLELQMKEGKGLRQYRSTILSLNPKLKSLDFVGISNAEYRFVAATNAMTKKMQIKK